MRRGGSATIEAHASGEVDPDLVIAKGTSVPDLPGFLRKRLPLALGETGILARRDQVEQVLRPGKPAVGSAFLGWG